MFFLAIVCVACVGFGLGAGFFQHESRYSGQGKLASDIHPERDLPITQFKSFVVVLYAQNDADWCERSLRSIFAQDYESFRLIFVDDGSTDGTFERAKNFIIESAEEHRTILIQNDTPCGLALSLDRAVSHCLDQEIVVPLFAKDWMALPSVLSNWNRSFQNPDVWVAFGQMVSYPSYEFLDPPSINLKEIGKKGWGAVCKSGAAHCFYSRLFKEIKAENLQGDYLVALLDRSGGRVKSVRELMSFRNETVY
jgi:glycosyltransferase involved in cell wall biosynthesis